MIYEGRRDFDHVRDSVDDYSCCLRQKQASAQIRLLADVSSDVKISNPMRLMLSAQTGAFGEDDETSRRG